MSIKEFESLSTEDKIDYACRFEPVAWRELKPRWFFIVYNIENFFVELRFDEYRSDKLAIDSRVYSAYDYNNLVRRNYFVSLNFSSLKVTSKFYKSDLS